MSELKIFNFSIMLSTDNIESSELKICDFGLSRFFKEEDNILMTGSTGTTVKIIYFIAHFLIKSIGWHLKCLKINHII